MPAERKVPNKLFFKIGEVCEITDTQPYVLRYWESDPRRFARPKQLGSGSTARTSTRACASSSSSTKRFTIAGAKKRLESELAGRVDTPIPPGAMEAAGIVADESGRTALRQVRDQLREILTLLDRNGKTPV